MDGVKPTEPTQKISDQIEGWLRSDEPKTLGSLVELFEEKSFAVIFVLLLAVPALPLPTGGATHVFEVIAMLLSLQLVRTTVGASEGDGTAEGRTMFVGLMGLLVGGVNLALILLEGSYVVFIHPCT